MPILTQIPPKMQNDEHPEEKERDRRTRQLEAVARHVRVYDAARPRGKRW